jgi:hypothetical protein
MHCSSVLVASAILLAAGCSPAFKDKRTPSGDFCTDMAVIPADQEPNLEYHRLVPVQSDMKVTHTEAERLESLRKAACMVGGDAVIEAVNEEVRNENAQYVLVSSGTAVIWVRPKGGGEAVPLTTHKKPKANEDGTPQASASAAATTAPVAPPTATPAVPSATAVAPIPTAAPVASVAPTATPTAAPAASSAKPVVNKLPTNSAPKPINPTAPKKPK